MNLALGASPYFSADFDGQIAWYMLRFCQIARPFQKHVIFYRYDDKSLFAERVMHGTRDLPRRLLEPPAAD